MEAKLATLRAGGTAYLQLQARVAAYASPGRGIERLWMVEDNIVAAGRASPDLREAERKKRFREEQYRLERWVGVVGGGQFGGWG